MDWPVISQSQPRECSNYTVALPDSNRAARHSQSVIVSWYAQNVTGMGFDSSIRSKRKQIVELADRHGAANLRVFGSISRGDAGPGSDLDLLVNFAPDRSLLDHVALQQDLEELLERKVDVVTEEALHWYIRDKILSEAVPL